MPFKITPLLLIAQYAVSNFLIVPKNADISGNLKAFSPAYLRFSNFSALFGTTALLPPKFFQPKKMANSCCPREIFNIAHASSHFTAHIF